MSMAYIRRHYGVPAKRGMRVVANGQPGVITGTVDGKYLRIRLDGVPRSLPHHPTWRIDYPNWRREQQIAARRIVTINLPGVSQ